MPDLSIENKYSEQVVCGVDEVGRGCLAGDVYAAAVIIPNSFPDDILKQLKDSKKLSAKKRETLSQEIKKHAIFSIEKSTVEEIDSINILNAALLAMERAIKGLNKKPDVCLIDGNKSPNLPEFTVETVIKGDSLSCSIAAASIIAKVERDRVMTELASKHPYYMWENNAGYGTKAHLKAIKEHGITSKHRKSFSPCK
ncbi:MAG: ribonuclease HII [Alphaproteobacteria bacterium]|jgi:ribonuclease HII|nr:ribonuclease HII [Alphaproteobacteria bacterium]